MNKLTACIRGAIAALTVATLLGCSSTPAPPDWKLNAQGAAERAVAAYLEGRQRVDQAETARLRAEIARTGDLALMARVELLRCAAQVASLDPSACTAFDALRQDAQPPELAYARYLEGKLAADDVALLPATQQASARALLTVPAASGGSPVVGAIDDPMARLVAAGVWFRAGRASPALVELAVSTASSQAWSRPLLAWLLVQKRSAESAGDRATAGKANRRIELLQSGGVVAPVRP